MKIKITNTFTEEVFEYELVNYILAYRIHDKEVDKVIIDHRDKEAFHLVYHLAQTILSEIESKSIELTVKELKIRKVNNNIDSIRLNDDMEKASFLQAYHTKDQMYIIDFYEEDGGKWFHIKSTGADFVMLLGVNQTLLGGLSPVIFAEPLTALNDMAFCTAILKGILLGMNEMIGQLLDETLVPNKDVKKTEDILNQI